MQHARLLSATTLVASTFALPIACDDRGGATGSGGSGGGDSALSYYRDAKPILDAKCVNCHAEGGIGPFRLDSYEAVAEHATAVKAAVVAGTMPPWMPGDDCNEYLDDRSLDEAQIDVLARWVDAGAPSGEPADEGPPLVLGDSRALSRVDLELGLDAPYEMRVEPDDYRCFVIDWPGTETSYVTGFGAAPGNAAVVHHVIAFLATPSQVDAALALDAAEEGPGYTCYGGPGFNGEWIGAWAPGGEGLDMPEGTGIRIEPGSKVVMQVHYNSLTAGKQPDQTRLRFKVDAEVSSVARLQPWANPQWLQGDTMAIPPASDGVEHSWAQDPTLFFSGGKPIRIHSSLLHMHQLGKTARLSIEHADGSETCLLDIPRWDFHWQGSYALIEPARLAPGDRLRVRCTWDNPTTELVTWGEGTTDEMCLGGFYYTVED